MSQDADDKRAVPTQPRLRPKPDQLQRAHVVERAFGLARTTVRCVAVVGAVWIVSYYGSKAVGRSTTVDIRTTLSVILGIRLYAEIALVGGATAWAMMERAARRRTIKRYAPYIAGEERRIDPSRTTSGLTERRDTHPRDRIQP